MYHGIVLGDANKMPGPQNSPIMHCQRRYSQASIATLEWPILFSTTIYESPYFSLKCQ